MRFNRRDFDGCARRALLWCAVFLCISPLPGGWLVDHCPFRIRDPEAGMTIALWEMATPHPAILILGSSRLGTFLRTSELRALASRYGGNGAGNIFNACLPADEPIGMGFLTRELLNSRVPPPRLVLVEMSPDLLSRDNPYFTYVITRDLVAADLPNYMSEILLSGGATSKLLASRLTPFFVHRSQIMDWAADTVGRRLAKEEPHRTAANSIVEGMSFQGGRDIAEKITVPLVDRIEKGTHRFRSRLQHYDLASRTSAAFEATVALLHDRGCAIVLVQPPLSSPQRALFTAEVRRPFGDFLQRLTSSYGCEFVDFSDRLPDTLFSDNQHGNNAGSIVFTELLAKEAIAPAWRNLMLEKTGD